MVYRPDISHSVTKGQRPGSLNPGGFLYFLIDQLWQLRSPMLAFSLPTVCFLHLAPAIQARKLPKTQGCAASAVSVPILHEV